MVRHIHRWRIPFARSHIKGLEYLKYLTGFESLDALCIFFFLLNRDAHVLCMYVFFVNGCSCVVYICFFSLRGTLMCCAYIFFCKGMLMCCAYMIDELKCVLRVKLNYYCLYCIRKKST
jgi:hypothetical protein